MSTATWVMGKIRPHTARIYPADLAFLEKVFKDRSKILKLPPSQGFRVIYAFYSACVLADKIGASTLGHVRNALDHYQALAKQGGAKDQLQLSTYWAEQLGIKDWPPIDDFRGHLIAKESQSAAIMAFINGFIHLKRADAEARHRIYINIDPQYVPCFMGYLVGRLYDPKVGIGGVVNVKCASIGVNRTDTIVIFCDGSWFTRRDVLKVIAHYQQEGNRKLCAQFRHLRPPLTKAIPHLVGISEAMEPPQLTYMNSVTGEFQEEGIRELQSFGKFNAEIILTALTAAGDDEGLFVTLVQKRLATTSSPMPQTPWLCIGDYDKVSAIKIHQTQFVIGGPPKTSLLSDVKDPFRE